jgi:hypothetical protein
MESNPRPFAKKGLGFTISVSGGLGVRSREISPIVTNLTASVGELQGHPVNALANLPPTTDEYSSIPRCDSNGAFRCTGELR